MVSEVRCDLPVPELKTIGKYHRNEATKLYQRLGLKTGKYYR
jgi:hypothetical protein